MIYSGAWYDDCHPFNELCKEVDVARDADDLKERESALVIWGGADIHPSFYGKPMHQTTHPGGMRDRIEWGLMQRAIEMQIPIFGVCRGAQMLCAAAGGLLIQHVQGHAGSGGHSVKTVDGKEFNVNSIHHQMMCGLEKVDHELVAWSSERRSKDYGIAEWANEEKTRSVDMLWTPPDDWKEPEFVYFPKINGYAIQWHPEAMTTRSTATQYVLNYITKKEEARHGSNSFPIPCAC